MRITVTRAELTPGPWKEIVDEKDNFSRYIIGAGNVYVATVENEYASPRHAYNAPGAAAPKNGAQIAAAPDLLAACCALIGHNNPPAGDPKHIDYRDAVRMARSAIEKASGE
ncbi:MAG TPA: hypothetical protein VNH18_08145 [Bryobacteraceae bacterium]|nr:hypothetical protein [Bryobacteraceae bacterium]